MAYDPNDRSTWPEGLAEAIQPDPTVKRAGASAQALADRFGLTYTQMRHLRKKLGLSPAISVTTKVSEEVCAAELGRMTDTAFAAKYGITRQAAHQRRSKLGIEPVQKPFSGTMRVP